MIQTQLSSAQAPETQKSPLQMNRIVHLQRTEWPRCHLI